MRPGQVIKHKTNGFELILNPTCAVFCSSNVNLDGSKRFHYGYYKHDNFKQRC